jgi:hypothetical protein
MYHLDTWPFKRVHGSHCEYMYWYIIWMRGHLKESTAHTVSTSVNTLSGYVAIWKSPRLILWVHYIYHLDMWPSERVHGSHCEYIYWIHYLDTWPSKRVHGSHREYISEYIIWMCSHLKESTAHTMSTLYTSSRCIAIWKSPRLIPWVYIECKYIIEQTKEGHGFL